MISGSLNIVRASPTRWRSPLERPPHRSSCTITEIDRVECLTDARPGLMQTVEIGEELQVLGHGQSKIKPRRLGHHRDAPADLHSVLPGEWDPRDRRRARARRDQRAESTHGGGLARAVRTQEPEHLTVSDFERDLGERGPLTETLRQVVDHERRARPLRVADLGIASLVDTILRRSVRRVHGLPRGPATIAQGSNVLLEEPGRETRDARRSGPAMKWSSGVGRLS